MKTITLTQGKCAVVDDVDYEWLNQWKWHACKVEKGRKLRWYAKRHVTVQGKQRTIFMHRLIVSLAGWREIDHKDGDGLNNQRHNLRAATHAQNIMNSVKASGYSSIHKGVCWHKKAKKWMASICLDGRARYLGLFETEEDAAEAYSRSALLHFGDFAKP